MEASTRRTWRGPGVVALLTVFAFAVHGYHPYAEDGGLYVAGIKRALHPAMYGPAPGFVIAPARLSLFAPMVAGIVRGTHLPLPWILLALYCTSIWTTLFAGWMLTSRCILSETGRAGAVALLACWLTLPIAGTSLMLMDPYVTARSLSTPIVLLALAWMLDGEPRGWVRSAAALLAAALVHPLMAGYGVAAALLLASQPSPGLRTRLWRAATLCAAALLLAFALQANAPAESADYVRVAMSRYYWFPARWQWYEQFGLIAPLLLLLLLGRRTTLHAQVAAHSAVALGIIALVIAVLFARATLLTHLVARLQPLRCFQIVYELMILLLGARLGERWLKAHPWRWVALFALCGGTMFLVQGSIYPASKHLELPWRTPDNRWEQAFLWARDHTPPDALFALDAHYITRQGEDAQCFRAIAERDALPDYSKDGGEASIAPWLTGEWARGQAAQTGLDRESDAARAAKLNPLGATWTVLESATPTAWTCPYTNASAKVCRLP